MSISLKDSLPITKGHSQEEMEAAIGKYESSYVTQFAPLVKFVDSFAAFNQKFQSGIMIHPLIQKTFLPLAIFGGLKDVSNTYKMYDATGFDNLTSVTQTTGRALYQLINNYVIPAAVFKGVIRSGAGPIPALALAVGSSLASSYKLSQWTDAAAMKFRVSLKDYAYRSPSDLAIPITSTVIPTNDEYNSLFPGFMLAEAAPVYEVDPTLGQFIQVTGRSDATDMLEDPKNKALIHQGTIVPIPVPTHLTKGRFTNRFGDFSIVMNEDLKTMDKELGFTLPEDIRMNSQKKMLATVDSLYNKCNKL